MGEVGVDLAPMKTHSFYLLAVAGGVALFTLAVPRPISGQNALTAESTGEMSPQTLALIRELTEQNKQLTANQAAMDAKVDALAETIRQARLFASRGGAGKGAK